MELAFCERERGLLELSDQGEVREVTRGAVFSRSEERVWCRVVQSN